MAVVELGLLVLQQIEHLHLTSRVGRQRPHHGGGRGNRLEEDERQEETQHHPLVVMKRGEDTVFEKQ